MFCSDHCIELESAVEADKYEEASSSDSAPYWLQNSLLSAPAHRALFAFETDDVLEESGLQPAEKEKELVKDEVQFAGRRGWIDGVESVQGCVLRGQWRACKIHHCAFGNQS